MTDTAATTETQARRTPQLVDSFEGDFPTTNKGGFWKSEATKIMADPGKIFTYKDVSSTAASYLRKELGLDAVTRTKDKVVYLYVRYVPERVDEIKAEVKRRAESRKAAAAANKAAASKASAKSK